MTDGDLAECMSSAGLPDIEDEVPGDARTRRPGNEDGRHEYADHTVRTAQRP